MQSTEARRPWMYLVIAWVGKVGRANANPTSTDGHVRVLCIVLSKSKRGAVHAGLKLERGDNIQYYYLPKHADIITGRTSSGAISRVLSHGCNDSAEKRRRHGKLKGIISGS